MQAQVGGGLPGVKYPHLFVAFAVPARGVSNDKVAEALHAELARMATEDVTDEELARFKTRAKADLIRSLDSNSGLAEQLVTYQTLTGDWREIFKLHRADRSGDQGRHPPRRGRRLQGRPTARWPGSRTTRPRPQEARDEPHAHGSGPRGVGPWRC